MQRLKCPSFLLVLEVEPGPSYWVLTLQDLQGPGRGLRDKSGDRAPEHVVGPTVVHFKSVGTLKQSSSFGQS